MLNECESAVLGQRTACIIEPAIRDGPPAGRASGFPSGRRTFVDRRHHQRMISRGVRASQRTYGRHKLAPMRNSHSVASILQNALQHFTVEQLVKRLAKPACSGLGKGLGGVRPLRRGRVGAVIEPP